LFAFVFAHHVVSGLAFSFSRSINLLTWISGIFGYINYLVEKDRKFIVDTLLNGM
jgi:hypothetical protein